MPATLRPRFLSYVRHDLPGGIIASGFRHEQYIGQGRSASDPVIHELLVDLKDQDNETFFSGISENKQGAEADRYLVFKALDYARENKIFPVAINIYLQSAYNYDFIDSVIDYLGTHGIKTENLVLELLEYDMPAIEDDLSALDYAREKGLRFALDDFDPRFQTARLKKLAGYCSFVKFDKHVLWDFEAGRFPELPQVFQQIRAAYPQIRFIAEGVSPDFKDRHPELDFDATQSNADWDIS